MSSGPEYRFRCTGCDREIVMIPAAEEALEDIHPGPYCEQCGVHDSYKLLSAETPPLSLYWVETDDHDEDWFVVARDQDAAEAIHEGAEGYGEGQANATLLCSVPAELGGSPGWPSLEQLKACGARILRRETPRIVELAGRRFCEGMLEHELNQLNDDLMEENGGGRPNKTKRRTLN